MDVQLYCGGRPTYEGRMGSIRLLLVRTKSKFLPVKFEFGNHEIGIASVAPQVDGRSSLTMYLRSSATELAMQLCWWAWPGVGRATPWKGSWTWRRDQGQCSSVSAPPAPRPQFAQSHRFLRPLLRIKDNNQG